MDLSKEGLEMFFKPYQIQVLKTLWSTGKPLNSGEVWRAIGVDQISRASVINFLNEMTEDGFLVMETTTGKGGHYGLYSPRWDEKGTKKHLVMAITEKLQELV